jgi:hypothetical protein
VDRRKIEPPYATRSGVVLAPTVDGRHHRARSRPCSVVLLRANSSGINAKFAQPFLHVLDHRRRAADVGASRRLSRYGLDHHGRVDATVMGRASINLIAGEA